ncbi:phage recombinase [Escherichia coli]|uniref:Phage recombinase n=1 Tax=Escherichia coli TaxID=562 RepID=A0A2X3K9E3_ECOLX|nr:phage recombinase [Escherichia coli]
MAVSGLHGMICALNGRSRVLIGYVRVSTNDQNTDLQRNALVCAGCEQIFEDKLSGTRTDRPGLKRALKRLQKGDTLVVWKLDRLGRSMKHLISLVGNYESEGLIFAVLLTVLIRHLQWGVFLPRYGVPWLRWNEN